MRKLLTLCIALAAIVLLSRAGNAADFRIDIGEAAPGRLIVVGLACKGTGASSVSSKDAILRREVTTESAGETLDLWSGVIPTGSRRYDATTTDGRYTISESRTGYSSFSAMGAAGSVAGTRASR